MDVYISRQAAIKKLINNLTYMHTFGADRSIDLIEELPSEDVQPVRHGHWINRHYRDITMKVCSECLEEFSYDAETGVSEYNYCPNCGARMEGWQNE